jgi:hypothetical protein
MNPVETKIKDIIGNLSVQNAILAAQVEALTTQVKELLEEKDANPKQPAAVEPKVEPEVG